MKALKELTQASRQDGRSRSRSWVVRVVVCVVLIAFLAVMQVPHLHASQSDADHCPLCVVMHSTAPAAVAAAAVVLVPMGALAPEAEPGAAPTIEQARSFIRPPPAGR